MAATISPALAAAQASSPRFPALFATAEPAAFGVPRLHWRQLWIDNTPDQIHQIAAASDGSLIRARNVSGSIAIQRIPDPSAPDAPWHSWTTGFASTASGRGFALAAHPSNGEVLLLYTRSNTVYFRRSTDNGVSFGAETAILTEASEPLWPALAIRASTGNACAFWALGTTNADVRRTRRTSGTWAGTSTSAGTTLSNEVHTVTGIAALHDGADFALLISGTRDGPPNDKRVWATRMGDGNLPSNTWATPVAVAESDSTSTLTFHTPAILYHPARAYRGAFAARETGNVAFNRAFTTHTAFLASPSTTWAEPAPHEAASQFGLSLALHPNGQTAYASTASRVWRAPIGGSLDLTARVRSARVTFQKYSTSATLTLDDPDGSLSGGLAADPPGPLAPGHQLTLNPGYFVGGSPAFGVSWTLHIDSLRSALTRDGHRTLEVRASGPWERLDAWTAPQARSWAASVLTRGNIAQFLAGRAGVPLTAQGTPYGPSNPWLAFDPAFALLPGESAAAALRRLLAPVSDHASPDGPAGGLSVRNWADPRWEPTLRRLAPDFYLPLFDTPPGAVRVQEHAAGQHVGLQASPGFQQPGPLAPPQPSASMLVGQASTEGLTDAGAYAWLTAATNWTLVALVRLRAFRAAGAGNRSGVLYTGNQGSASNKGLGIGILPSGNVAAVFVGASGGPLFDMGTPPLTLDSWNLVVLNRDTSTTRAYLNGVQTSATTTTAPQAPAVYLTAGHEWTGSAPAQPLDGWLAALAIFKRPLPNTEIALLQEARNPAQWTLGDGFHPLSTTVTGPAVAPTNWTRVDVGLGGASARYADAFAPANVYAHGERRKTMRVLDAHQDVRATAYAAGALARSSGGLGSVTIPHHAGIQLGDIVRLADPAPPTLARVIAIDFTFDRATARYDQTLTLGGLS